MYRRKSVIIIVMCVAVLLMTIGYAAFSASLKINGTANIASTWEVEFTKIEQVSKTSGVTVTTTPTASGTSATFNVDLTSPGDKIEYKITVSNSGTLDAIISNIDASETGSDAIKFEIIDIQVGDKLKAKATTTFNVTISYNNSVTEQPFVTVNNLVININYVQDVGQTITNTSPDIDKEYDYIQNGLVLRLDAFNNTGNGHSTTTTTWKDLSGNGNDATLKNFSFDSSSGWLNNGLKLDGSNDIVTVNPITNPLSKNLTIDLVIRNDTIDNSGNGFGETLVSLSQTTYNNYPIWITLTSGGNVGVVAWSSSSTASVTSSFANYLGKITNVTITTNSSNNTIKLYMNGQLVKTVTNTFGDASYDTYYFGDLRTGRGIAYNGYFYSILFYNRTLSDSEVASNYATNQYRYEI